MIPDLLSTRSAGLLASVLFILAGCGTGEYRPHAVGPISEITVVIDSHRWHGPVGEAIRDELGRSIATLPVPEAAFDLRPVELTSGDRLTRLRQRRNVMFVTPIDDSTNIGQFMRARLSEAVRDSVNAGRAIYVVKPNLWRQDQIAMYLTAASDSGLVRQIHRAGDEMRGVFNRVARQRMEVEMFERGRQVDIEEQLMEKHGFAINIQHDYFIAVDTTNTIWLRRIVSSESWRSVLVHYVENADPQTLSPAWIRNKVDSLTQEYMEGSRAGFLKTDYRRPLTIDRIDFLGNYGFEMRGLWTMVEEVGEGEYRQLGMGGPFLTYAFYHRPSDRIYIIHGSVFAPGYDKRPFLRQMEVIAHTFRSNVNADGDDVAQRSQSNAPQLVTKR